MKKARVLSRRKQQIIHTFVTAIATFAAMAVLTTSASAILNRGLDGQKQMPSLEGEFVIELRHDFRNYDKKTLEQRLGGQILRQVRPNMIVLRNQARESRRTILRKLLALSEVRLAEPNYILHAIQTPNDPDFKKLWGLANSGIADKDGMRGLAGVDVGAEKAWEIQKGSKKVVVAVIDTGIDLTHPDLKNNIWINQAEANGKAGVDDDNNGYIDDINGFNFVDNTGSPKDDHGHGTHCAGTIGGEGDNGVGIVGLNWQVSLMAIKFLNGEGSGTLEAAVKALDYASKSPATILSNSWGGVGSSDILKEAVGRTNAAGKLFIVAAGNNTHNNDADETAIPASYAYENVLAVAAIDNRGELAFYSNYGAKRVHVAAPGTNVYSSFKDGTYATHSGTSMAAPHVSGIAALLSAQNPAFTILQIKEKIISSARPLRGLNGKVVSGGLADAYYALSSLKPPPDPNDPSLWTERVAHVVATDHPYKEKTSQTFQIQIAGAKRLSIHFAKFETENTYDRVQFLTPAGESLGYMSGNKTGQFGPIVDGDTVVLKFTSDSTVNGYGFDVDSVAIEK